MPTPTEELAATAAATEQTTLTQQRTAELVGEDLARANGALARVERVRAALERSDLAATSLVAAFPGRVQPVVDSLSDALATSELDAFEARLQEALSVNGAGWTAVTDAVAQYDTDTAALDDPTDFDNADEAADLARDAFEAVLTALDAADVALARAVEAVKASERALLQRFARARSALDAGAPAEAARIWIGARAARTALSSSTSIASLEAARTAARGAVDTPLETWVTAEEARLEQAVLRAQNLAAIAVRTEGRKDAVETIITDTAAANPIP